MTEISSASLTQRAADSAPLLQEVWTALRDKLVNTGLPDLLDPTKQPFSFTNLRRDPYDGSEALYGEWRDPNGRLLGNLIVHEDGKTFAEFDVVQPHPTDQRWFVEGVSAWGKSGAIKTELKLLPALGA